MTREQRRSKSRLHNRMKRCGYAWRRRGWWRAFRFAPLTIRTDPQGGIWCAPEDTP